MTELDLPGGAEVGREPHMTGPAPLRPLAPGDPDGPPDQAPAGQPPPPGQEAPELSGLEAGGLGEMGLRLVHRVQPPGAGE